MVDAVSLLQPETSETIVDQALESEFWEWSRPSWVVDPEDLTLRGGGDLVRSWCEKDLMSCGVIRAGLQKVAVASATVVAEQAYIAKKV